MEVVIYSILLIFNLCKAFAKTALATAIIETVFFAMLKYHKKNFLFFVFAINIFSNLLLNISLSLLPEKSINIYTGELFVIIFEFFAFLFFLKTNAKNSLRLFLMTVSSNLISYFAGLIFYNILGIL